MAIVEASTQGRSRSNPKRGTSTRPCSDSSLKRAIAGLGKAAKLSQRLAAPVRMTAVFDPHRRAPQVSIEPVTVEPAAAGDLELALAEARERGAKRAAEILAAPEMLSADAFARLIGVTREAVRLKRRRHEVLGLESAKRGVRFPDWQVTRDGGLLPGLPQLFERLGGNSWTVYRFLLQHHPELGGKTAIAVLRTGKMEPVLSAAESAGFAFS